MKRRGLTPTRPPPVRNSGHFCSPPGDFRPPVRKSGRFCSPPGDFGVSVRKNTPSAYTAGRIDILVNNAGITKDGLVMRMSEQQWDAVIAVNMKSAFNFLHAVVPVMARQKGGSIINMASIAGQTGNPGQVNYSASKAGLIAMAKSVAKEMGPRGAGENGPAATRR